MMKSYDEYLVESKNRQTEMHDWIANQVDNTEKAHDEIKKEFLKKYGAKNAKFFDKVVSEIVD
jgi:hypothetical protein